MNCTNCGTEIVEGQAFCPKCGAAQQPAADAGAAEKPWPFAAGELADFLAERGLLAADRARALASDAEIEGRSIVDVIRESGALGDEQLRDAMSDVFGVKRAELGRELSVDLFEDFPLAVVQTFPALPILRDGDRLELAVADPTRAEPIRAIHRAMNATLDLRLATYAELAPLVAYYFMPSLVAVLPDGQTRSIALGTGDYKIGRGDFNEVSLAGDEAAEISHAVLRGDGTGYELIDFGSASGVFVNGDRIDAPRALANGDIVTIGASTLTFKAPLAAAARGDENVTRIVPRKERPAVRTLSVTAVSPPAAQQAAQAANAAPAQPSDARETAANDETTREPESAVDSFIADTVDPDDEVEGKGVSGKVRVRAAWIGFASRVIAQVLGAAAMIFLGLALTDNMPSGCNVPFLGRGAGEPAAPSTTNGAR